MSHRILADLLEAFSKVGPGYVPLTATAGGTRIPNNKLVQLVIPTWGSASNILMLPSAVPGTGVVIAGGATGGVLQSSNSPTITVNGAATQKVAPDQMVVAFCETPTQWKAIAVASNGSISGLADSTAARVFRGRYTVAQVNAGAVMLPAMPGLRYRVQDMSLISVGGASAGATSVDVTATQGASGVLLLAAAVAGLTQNTLLRAGAANAAILAGGLSFAACDANTAIGIAKTGGTLITATHIDVMLTYTAETA